MESLKENRKYSNKQPKKVSESKLHCHKNNVTPKNIFDNWPHSELNGLIHSTTSILDKPKYPNIQIHPKLNNAPIICEIKTNMNKCEAVEQNSNS